MPSCRISIGTGIRTQRRRNPTLLGKLADLPIKSLRTLPYKLFVPVGQPLHSLLEAVARYARALLDVDVDSALRADVDNLHLRTRHLESQAGIEPPSPLLSAWLISARDVVNCSLAAVLGWGR